MTHPSPITVPALSSQPEPVSPARQAFQQAILAVENLREQLRELQASQAEARRQYWQQVGPVAAEVVAARRALYAPLEEALLIGYFSRAEEGQLVDFILGNARSLEQRFGEDESAWLTKYGTDRKAPARPKADAPSPDDSRPPHEQAAAQARARRKTKAQKAEAAAAKAAQEEQQRLLSNTKTVYRQLARTHHPDLERDPAQQQHKTALMQRITEAYEAGDLYTLLQLLAESAPADQASDEVLQRYAQALTRQQVELKQQLNELKYGPQGFAGSTGKKQQTELRQLKRDLRAEAEYVRYVARLIQEPTELRELLRELGAAGQESV